MSEKKSNKAFSLIELSIVILIIGIIIAGVTQGSRLVAQFRLNTARTQTNSSPVSSIKGLTLWVDSTSENSFDDAEQEDGAEITNWYDLNPQTTAKANFVASTTHKPTYVKSFINNLPAVKFDGVDDFMESAGFQNVSNALSIFIVFNPQAQGSVLSKRDTGGDAGTNLQFDFFTTTFGWQLCNGGCVYSQEATKDVNKNYLSSIIYRSNSSASNAIKFFESGTEILGGSANTVGLSQISADSNLFLGQHSPDGGGDNNINAYMGEIIVFDRALKNEERKSVEQYLGKKWGMAVAQ